MRRSFTAICFLAALSLLTPAGGAWAAPPTPGGVETLIEWDADAGELVEGIAVDKRGRIYVTVPFIGELRRIDPDGSEHLVTDLPTTGDFGPLGLAVDAPGNVYATVVTFEAATHGVWRVTPSGAKTRLPGTEAVAFPNGVTFDDRGTLYITDTIAGAVWRVQKGGVAEPWIQHGLLEGDDSAPLPFPIGANGIKYHRGTIFVTNTELGRVVAIPVKPDGSPGTPTVVAQGAALVGADGLALDVHGGIYVAVIVQSAIVHVPAGGGSMRTIADGDDGLDFTSDVAFGTGKGERKTLFAVNFSVGPFFGATRTHGPGLLAVHVGVPGLPQP